VRGYGLSLEQNPSPDLLRKSTSPPAGRGEPNPLTDRSNQNRHAPGSANGKLPLVRSWSVCILPKFKSGNGAVVHLVRPVGQPHRAHRRIVPRQAGIVGNAGGADAWIALSMILSAMLGAATLIMAISSCASCCRPCPSCRRLQAQQAVHLDVGAGLGDALLQIEYSMIFLPKAVRDDSRRTIFSSASSALPMVRMQ